MSNLTDRAAYLLGLVKGMNLDTEKNENKLLLETLRLIEELAQEVTDLDNDTKELGDYIEELDQDLGEAEKTVYGDEEGCCCCDECVHEEETPEEDDCSEECCCCECDEDGKVHFDCPNCGKLVSLCIDDLDDEKNLKCKFCGEPFFTEPDDKESKKDKKKKKKKK